LSFSVAVAVAVAEFFTIRELQRKDGTFRVLSGFEVRHVLCLNESTAETHKENRMSSRSLVASPPMGLPIAQMRSVFRADDVERKLAHLQASGNERDFDPLRNTWQRMLERGPERFAVKPSGVPDMAPLYDLLPNFGEVLDDVKRHVALTQDSHDGLEVTPILLLGPPGVGKTHFARQIADLLGTSMSLIPMSSMTAGWLLSGSSSQWKGAKPGKVFEALVDGQYANPVIVVDEIDKASADAQYDPMGALYSLLEHDTAQSFVDEFAEVPIDASQVIWITTANDERSIPEPILNRMNVFEIATPSPEAARKIAAHLYRGIRGEHDWGQRFDPEPVDDVLDQLATLAPREMRRALVTAFGNARLDNRYSIESGDLPKMGTGKSRIGFLQ
jgi:ATP-dependent Lon protease